MLIMINGDNKMNMKRDNSTSNALYITDPFETYKAMFLKSSVYYLLDCLCL